MENQRRFQIFHIAVNHSGERIVFYCQSLVRQSVEVQFVSKVCVGHQICDSEFGQFAFKVERFLNVFGEFFGGEFCILFAFWADDDDFSRLEDHDGALGFGFPDDEGGEPLFVESGVLDFLGKEFEVDFFINGHFAIRDDVLDDGSLTGHGFWEMTQNNVYKVVD